MDIAGLSTSMSMAELQTGWGMKMLSKAMDTAQSQGAQLAEMISSGVLLPGAMQVFVIRLVGAKR